VLILSVDTLLFEFGVSLPLRGCSGFLRTLGGSVIVV
jgi:hypothetical protein